MDGPTDLQLSGSGSADTSVDGEIPLRSVNFVTNHIPAIEVAQTKITNEMQKMVLAGLEDLVRTSSPNLRLNIIVSMHPSKQNRSLLASSLQTAHNLRILPNLVQSLVADLTDAVDKRIRVAFDMALISKDVAAKGESRS